MGNSEVGHLNLGAGTVVRQDLTRIDDAVADGVAGREPGPARRLRGGARVGPAAPARARLRRRRPRVSMDHLRALIELAADHGVPDVVLHAFTDGRDTLPRSGAGYLETRRGLARRDAAAGSRPSAAATSRWTATSAGTARQARLRRDRPRARPTRPTPTRRRPSRPSAPPTSAARPTSSSARRWSATRREIRDGDAVVFFNFRPDRARELTRALAEPDFAEFDRGDAPARRLHDADRVPGGLGLPDRLPARPAEGDAGVGARRARHRASCTSPRPRSTRTSPTSSTAARSTPTTARSAAWSTRRATSRPTTTSPR